MMQRIITGVLAAAVFLTLLYLGKFLFAALIILAAVVGFFEYIKMFKYKLVQISSIIGFASVFYLVFPWENYLQLQMLSFEAMIWIILLILLSITVISKNKFNIEQASILLIGILYIGMGFHYIIVTRFMENGLFWTLLIFACVWITDIGAYFTGWAIGKRLLWPSISPKKTVEGAVGAIVFSIAAAILFSLYAPELLPIQNAVWIGFVVSIVGQLGDFIQSAYKRVRGVKDSGTILPGHGGVLDRCDSWLIVFPLVHLLSLLP
jgi:phosphatidate cytidylyltransferase